MTAFILPGEAMMIDLLRAEWLKLSRRPLTWVLLAVFLALTLFMLAGFFMIALLTQATLSEGQAVEFGRRIVFPGLFGTLFSVINGPGGFFAVILAASAIGSEYSWGTLRTHFARYPARLPYLVAKLIVVLLLLLLGMLITLVVGGLAGWGLGILVGRPSQPDLATLAILPLALLRALYVYLPYVLLTFCFTVVWRSLLAGLAGGLLYIVLESGFGTLATFLQFGGIWDLIYALTIQQNINTLVMSNSHAFGLRPEDINTNFASIPSPPMWQATLVVALYSALLLAAALRSFSRHDLADRG